MTYEVVDIEKWYRKEAFYFFRDYDDPFFSITANVNITPRYTYCKNSNQSIFLHLIYCAMVAMNQIEDFRMRIVDNSLVKFEKIHGGSTILNDDNTFSFAYFDYTDNIREFLQRGQQAILKVNEKKGMDPRSESADLIYFSSIPWVSFTSFKHARKKIKDDSIPRIVFGKFYKTNEQWILPVSIACHHSIIDGYHVGEFFRQFEEILRVDPI